MAGAMSTTPSTVWPVSSHSLAEHKALMAPIECPIKTAFAGSSVPCASDLQILTAAFPLDSSGNKLLNESTGSASGSASSLSQLSVAVNPNPNTSWATHADGVPSFKGRSLAAFMRLANERDEAPNPCAQWTRVGDAGDAGDFGSQSAAMQSIEVSHASPWYDTPACECLKNDIPLGNRSSDGEACSGFSVVSRKLLPLGIDSYILNNSSMALICSDDLGLGTWGIVSNVNGGGDREQHEVELHHTELNH
mmetsp:Transcript_71835/g.120424  ORF Transcript_71835/g.120424 Transcript_71835/m.120424 type:complete len:250 (-) Transcript_71835:40-789(-)